MALASIIITTYNRPHLLSRAILSARAASARDVEIIVVDDNSELETAHVCANAGNIKYVRNEVNLGVAGARKRGLRASCGEYLSFLDDDDIRLAGTLDAQIDALAAAPEKVGLIYGQAILGRGDGSPTNDFYPSPCPHGDVFRQLLTQNFVPCGAAVFRRSCLVRVGLPEPNLAGIDDWDLWIRIAEFYTIKAHAQPVMIWRKSTPVSKQGTSDAIKIAELSINTFRDRWLKLPRANRELTARECREISRRFSMNIARHLLWEAWRSLIAGQARRAAQNILTAVRLCSTAVVRVAVSPHSLKFLLKLMTRRRQMLNNSISPRPQQETNNKL